MNRVSSPTPTVIGSGVPSLLPTPNTRSAGVAVRACQSKLGGGWILEPTLSMST